MPWCPKCKYEYREGFTHCADCGAELTAEPPVRTVLRWKTEVSAQLVYEPRELLATANSEPEASEIVALLDSAGIPAYKAYPRVGSYMHVLSGGTQSGVEIYVPNSLMMQAGELLQILRPDGEAPQTPLSRLEAGAADELEELNRRRKRRLRIILLVTAPIWIYILYKLAIYGFHIA